MKMKKVTALLLSVAMIATLAVGCGSKDDKDANKDGKKVLKVAAFEGGNGAQIWKNIEKAFEEENKDVDVELHLSSELDKDLTKNIKNGKVPDVVYYNLGQASGFTETMLKEKAIADISDVFDDELKGKLVSGITENAAAQPYGDGKIYLAPIMYTPTGLWYNKDLFEGPNKKYDLPTTWDEFFALGDKAKADGISLFTYPQSGYFDSTMYQMLAQAGGIDFYNKAVNYDKDTWTSEAGKKVTDTVAKLAQPKYLQADTVANANADGGFKINQQNVIDGKALFMPNGNWVIGEMANSTPKEFNWSMMAPPKFSANDEKHFIYTFTEQMWVPAEAENMDLAKKFVKFMYSDKVVDLMIANETTNKETGEKSAAPIVAPVVGASDKLPEGTIKDTYTLANSEGYETVSGAWATTKPIEGFDMKATVYGKIDALNSGEMKAADYNKLLVDTWKKLAENVE
ncbi:carbohydrate ABC transporter substrate-binding protein [Faecalimonas sp.]